MKYSIFSLFLFLSICSLYAQDDEPLHYNDDLNKIDIPIFLNNDTINLKKLIKSHVMVGAKWHNQNKLQFNLTQVSFVNWNAGGNNSISGIANGHFTRKYDYAGMLWNNELTLKYGFNATQGQSIRKTDDEISFNSTFGYQKATLSSWYFSSKFSFKTQFSDGYNYPDTDNPISRFMSPGYLSFGLGSQYAPKNKKFTAYFSPGTLKSTFVLDQRLANQGAFGVTPAEYDDDGNMVKQGKNVMTGFGILFNSEWEKEIYKNMILKNSINMYTDYINNFGNVDVDWEINIDLMVNQFVKANLGLALKYDDDVKFEEYTLPSGETIAYGARTQFKQLLGVGMVYTFD
ncbi:DUF3078 domain-containing protein [Zhouia sp. PK063]|uniref:DUF3078 domain-containing protein n=1 Tax=Zhouia sp. PK063 TaxID=3373602 RepID=UPI003788E3A8